MEKKPIILFALYIFFNNTLLKFLLPTLGQNKQSFYQEHRPLYSIPDSIIILEVKFRQRKSFGIRQRSLAEYDLATLIKQLYLRSTTRRQQSKGLSGHADERLDLFDLKSYEAYSKNYKKFEAIAKSVPALIPKKYLSRNANGDYTFNVIKPYWKTYEFCDEYVRFGLQPSYAIGTAFIVKNNLIVTAAHCLEGIKPSDIMVVFGYEMINDKNYLKILNQNNVYEIESIDTHKDVANHKDFAFIKTKAKLSNNCMPLQIRNNIVQSNEELFVIGYPQGLPIKCTGNCKFFLNVILPANIFKVKGDIFEGNSGSPVLDNKGQVVGMVIGGGLDTDIFKENDCPFIYNCDINSRGSCLGESIQRTNVIKASLSN
jgi:hypothetical protein